MTIAKTPPVPDVLFMSVSEFDDSRVQHRKGG